MTRRAYNIGKAYDATIWHGSTRPGAVAAPLVEKCRWDAAYIFSCANDGVRINISAIHAALPSHRRTDI